MKEGKDVRIDKTAILKNLDLIEIGNHVAIDNGVTISTQLTIGDYVHIAPFVVMIGGKKSKVVLENFSFVAAGTKIVAGSEDYTGKGLGGPTIPAEFRDLNLTTVTFKKYSGCGVNCSVMPGVTFGEGAILGANSLATKDLEPLTIYVGSPAKPIATRNRDKILQLANSLIKNNDQ